MNKALARTVAMSFLEKIAKKSGHSVATLLGKVVKPQREQIGSGNAEPQSWSNFLLVNTIEMKSKQLYHLYKNGYT